jgi:hypothetical protein
VPPNFEVSITMDCCCQELRPSLRRRVATAAGWIVPTAVLALVPKCPVCVAAYAAALTGIGISISAATFLRASILVVATAALLVMAGIALVTSCKNRRRNEVTRSG